MNRIGPGATIALSSGAQKLVEYNEYDANEFYANHWGESWTGTLYIGGVRLACFQTLRGRSRRSLRKQAKDYLDKISPEWQIVSRVVQKDGGE